MALNAVVNVSAFRCKVARFCYFSTSNGLLDKRLAQRGNVLLKLLNSQKWQHWVINSRRFDLLDKGAEYAQRNCHLCAVHFEDSQFMNTQEKRRLIHDALPTLFAVPNPPPRITPRQAKPVEPTKTIVVLPPLLPEVRMKIDHSYATPEETAASDEQLVGSENTSEGSLNQKNLQLIMAGPSKMMHMESGFEFDCDVKSDEIIGSSLSCSSLDDDFAEWSALRPKHRLVGKIAVPVDNDFDKDNDVISSTNDKGVLSDYSDPAPESIAYPLETPTIDTSASSGSAGRTLFRVPLEELPSFMAQQKIAGLYRPSSEERSTKYQESDDSVAKMKREVRSLKTQVTRQKRRIWELEAEVERLEETAVQPQRIMQQIDGLGMSTFATSFIKSQVRRAMAKDTPSVPWSRADMEVATTLYQQSAPVYRVWQRFFTMPKMKTVVAYLEKCKEEAPVTATTSSS